MIHYYTKHGGRLRELEGPEIGCWMNITPPFSEEELEEVAQNLDIPLDFLTDSLDVDERSRYEREEETRFILLNSPFLNTSTEENDTIYVTIPIGIIITIDTVVTISSEENPVLQLFLDDKVKNFDPTDDSLLCSRSWNRTYSGF